MTPESLALDIYHVVNYTLRNASDYAVHIPGPNQDIALRAAQPDSDNHVSDITTVVRWVLFVTQVNEEDRSATTEGRRVRAAAMRLAALFEELAHDDGTTVSRQL